METVKRTLMNPIVAGVLGFLVGIFIGLVVLGWWLFPVEWEDADVSDLRQDAKVAYLRSCIDAFGYNGDAARAVECYESLGEGAPDALREIVQNPMAQDTKLIAAFGSIALTQTGQGEVAAEEVLQTPVSAAEAGAVEGAEGMPAPGSTVAPVQGEAEESGQGSWVTLVCALGLIFAAILAVLALLRRAGVIKIPLPQKEQAPQEKSRAEQVDYSATDYPPLTRSIAAYQSGNDLFDEVYSIEANGEFLGEYGVAIAEASGVGGPKRVTAFEVWLFDKNHIPTTTKVLMSEQTYHDSARRQKLEAKGETLLARPDLQILLETNTLRLVGRVTDMAYAEGAAGSYFDRFILELKVWQLD